MTNTMLPKVQFVNLDGVEDIVKDRVKFFSLKNKDDKKKVGFVHYDYDYDSWVADASPAMKKALKQKLTRKQSVVVEVDGKKVLREIRLIGAKIHSSRETKPFYCWGGDCCEIAKQQVPNPRKPGETKNRLTSSIRAITIVVVPTQNEKGEIAQHILENGLTSPDDYTVEVLKVYAKLYGSIQEINAEFPLVSNDATIKLENPDFHEYKGYAANGSIWLNGNSEANIAQAERIKKIAEGLWERLPDFLARQKTLEDIQIDLGLKEPKNAQLAVTGVSPESLKSELGDALK